MFATFWSWRFNIFTHFILFSSSSVSLRDKKGSFQEITQPYHQHTADLFSFVNRPCWIIILTHHSLDSCVSWWFKRKRSCATSWETHTDFMVAPEPVSSFLSLTLSHTSLTCVSPMSSNVLTRNWNPKTIVFIFIFLFPLSISLECLTLDAEMRRRSRVDFPQFSVKVSTGSSGGAPVVLSLCNVCCDS